MCDVQDCMVTVSSENILENQSNGGACDPSTGINHRDVESYDCVGVKVVTLSYFIAIVSCVVKASIQKCQNRNSTDND